MSLEFNLHNTQITILRELLFHTDVSFTKLQRNTNMSSDHFNFHLQKLIELRLIKKVSRGTYSLTIKGKEYANKLDTDNYILERQPKISVILVVEKQIDNVKYYIFQERLKQPYFGFLGLVSGKVRWGETIIETAKRELMEETGLTAVCRVAGVYHEIAYQCGTDEQLEDKIFFIVHCTEPTGELIDRFEGGHNSWMRLDNVMTKSKIFKNLDLKINFVYSDVSFIETSVEYAKDSF
ncbi:MAG: 8-oxo-dGTP diphosphatase [Patescibacteria group bacterium]|nr:8-oxo-dGTP diphosphatase [Patescibacteria group bacterium]